ncbi:MAG: Gfo/Idh/MocA family oxidoreductase [Deltaproteobacteria bacterium]|nr:Gfo/Idh/MocA family oxidoreductase [Deltaproteobacteria bacterium]
MTETLRAAVIGTGHLGALHAQKYAELGGVELTAVYDVDASRAAAVANACGCRAAVTVAEALSVADIASVAVPTEAHHAAALAVLDGGVHLLIEKPLASCAREGEEICAAAERAGRLVQVGHLERFNPAFEELRGVLGHPRFIECHRLSPFAGRGGDTDVVLDVMIHDLDLIAFLVGRPLASVEAVGVPVLSDHADIANARLRFEGGCIANVTASRVSLKRERRMRIFQEDAYVAVDFDARSVRVLRRKAGSGPVDPRSPMDSIRIEDRTFAAADPLRDEIEAFVAAVRGQRAVAIGGREALTALLIADRVRAAMREETAPA